MSTGRDSCKGAIEPVKRALMLSFILILLLTTTAFQNSLAVEDETQDVGYTLKMRVTYSNPVNGTRIWNLTEEDRTIGLFMNNTWQTAYLINHSYPLEMMKNDEDGNPIAVLSFPKLRLNPGENVSYTVAYRFLSKPRSIPEIIEEESKSLEEIPKDLKDRYSGAVGPWLVNDPELRELAHDIVKNETRVLTIVKRFIAWINQNITYVTHEIPFYPNETYAKREGDCDDKAVLFTTLCRIFGIPAYIQIGNIYLPTRAQTSETYWEGHVTSVLKRIGWHGWAMVYVPPWGWLPVDLTYVRVGLGDPLNAIKAGAVTLQETIQYLNITQTDYVALSREVRKFFTDNDFYVYMEDEMVLEPSPEPPKPPEPASDEPQGQPRLISVLIVAAVVGVTLAGASIIVFVLHVRKVKREKLRE
ncbi:MAG: transglutaminase family protein [Candidatus Bathyarchaeia archaeon]